MADDNLPAPAGTEVTTSREPTYDEHVEDLSKALQDDPLMADPVEATEEQTTTAAEETPDDDPLGLEAEDVETDATDEPDESEAEIKGGRFAPDTAKVTLDDGTVTTIAELKRGTLFQRDYTQKTQALSEERKSFEAERQQVSQYVQQVEQLREYASWYAEQYIPKKPAPFTGNRMEDPMGYFKWSEENDAWQAHAQAYQTFQQHKAAEDQKKQGETEEQFKARRLKEAKALGEAIPIFKDPAKASAAWDAMVSGAEEHFKLTRAELEDIVDHRQLVILREALAYRRLKAKAPQAPAEVARRPPVREGRRAPADQQQTRQKQSLTERLNKPGNFDAGVELLKNLII
ncbi:MAG: hypothetical protein EOO12_00250 [Chitinophagaceae bacterium]|nr:MAG: hypothetical protein EOO12_00250 [Chitinophagaceae bacterium]